MDGRSVERDVHDSHGSSPLRHRPGERVTDVGEDDLEGGKGAHRKKELLETSRIERRQFQLKLVSVFLKRVKGRTMPR
jgi:hypothetical protein